MRIEFFNNSYSHILLNHKKLFYGKTPKPPSLKGVFLFVFIFRNSSEYMKETSLQRLSYVLLKEELHQMLLSAADREAS